MGFLSKLVKARHSLRHLFKVSFHLLAKAHIETANIRKTRNAEVKVEYMKPVAREYFAQKGSLYAQPSKQNRNEETRKKTHLANGAGTKKHRKRRLAFQSTFDDTRFGFSG